MALDLIEATFKVADKSPEEPCPQCGALMSKARVGRPKKLCQTCTTKAIKERKRTAYLAKKYRDEIEGLTEDQAKELIWQRELKAQIMRDQRAIRRHKFWLNTWLRKYPGTWVIFSNLKPQQKEKVIRGIRKRALRLLREHEKS